MEDLLRKIGFNDKEIEVYLKILEHGKITPAHIARLTGIKRPTVYSITKELLDKGVVAEDLAAKQNYLVALPPQDLKNIVFQEQRKTKDKEQLINKAIGELQHFTKNTKYSIPKIQFVYEEDLDKFLYEQTPAWNESLQKYDNTWWGFQDPTFVIHYQKWIDWYWTKSASQEIELKLLTNQAPIEAEMAERKFERRQVKFWAKAGDFTTTTWVNGDYLIIIMTAQNPHYLVQIHDPIVAHNMRELFKSIWLNL